MPFLKKTRDQLQANAFVSHLEFAKTKFSSENPHLAIHHINGAFEALQKLRETQAAYIISREGWLYIMELCQSLTESMIAIGQHRLAKICTFMWNWALWNEDQISDDGVLSSVRSHLAGAAGHGLREEPVFHEDNSETRIHVARANKSVELDLSCMELTELPESLAALNELEYLILSDNKLRSLPDWMCRLGRLQNLDLSRNPIASLPRPLSTAPRLQILSICDANLTSLPANIVSLTSLQELHLSGNALTSLPDSLSNMTSLKKLCLEYNVFTFVPPCISRLPALEELYLHNNRLINLPDSLASLSKLRTLRVEDNLLGRDGIPPVLRKIVDIGGIGADDTPFAL